MKYLFIMLAIIGCSSKEPKKDPIIYSKDALEVNTTNPKSPSITSKQLAAEKGSRFAVELNFQKGSSSLNRIDKNKIKTTYKKALESDSAQVIELISWSDKEYSPEKSLSKEDQKLAKSRLDSLKNYINEIDPDVTIKEINMSKKPAKLTGLVNTYEADVKKSIEIQDAHKDKKSLAMIIFLPKK